MRLLPRTLIPLILSCSGSLGQTPVKTQLPKECVPVLLTGSPLPKAPFKFRAGESYKNAPVLKFQVNEDGSVTNVRLVRTSGVSDIDKQAVDSLAKSKYKPRPRGCGIIESEMSIVIDWH